MRFARAYVTLSSCSSSRASLLTGLYPHQNGALAYASVAYAAALAAADEELAGTTFDRSYASACTHLATFLETQIQDADATGSRRWLALADVQLGQLDRAWASAVNIPDPALRARLMARILDARIQRGEFEQVVALADYLPEEPHANEALCRIAEARVRSGRWNMVEMKKWAVARSGPSTRAAALAGIAVGITAGENGDLKETPRESRSGETASPDSDSPTIELLEKLAEQGDHTEALQAYARLDPDQRADARALEVFDRSAAQLPRWWLDRAAAVAAEVENPVVRAWVWVQLARAHREADSLPACRAALAEATHCTTAIWSEILARRPEVQRESEGRYRWRSDHRAGESEKSDIDALLRMLMAVERMQHVIGDSRGALDTLLLALKSVEPMPREGGYAAPVGPQSLTAWLSRISGRARLRGRHDVATVVFSAVRPADPSRLRDFERFLQGLAAAEAEDGTNLKRLADDAQRHYLTNKMSERATYAAILYARLALLAARRGDEGAYREAAMQVGGLVNASRGAAPRSVLLQLAEATALLGQSDVAKEYITQSRVYGAERDAVLARVATEFVREGRLAEADEVLQGIRSEEAKIPARYAISKALASHDSARPSAIFRDIEALPSDAEKASSLAGVAVATLSH